jgi:uncharacterized repeat protein (TIGR01451 family)
MISVNALESVKITDDDQDMSGAVIFAVKRGGPKYGEPVDIAVAYGQDPLVSGPLQPISMDLGTTVLPLPLIKVKKLVDKAIVVPGDAMTYTIRIVNIAQKKMESDVIVVKDVLDSDVTYIAGSASYISSTSEVAAKIPDSATGTPFPLDAEGFTIPLELFRRGGAIDVTFKVKLSVNTKKSKIINTGVLSQNKLPDMPFDVSSTVEQFAAVGIENKVYLGWDNGAKCGTIFTSEYVEDVMRGKVTYCFEVQNTGKAHLGSIVVSNADLSYSQPISGLVLAPREKRMVYTNMEITVPLTNKAVVVANPVTPTGEDIPGIDDVTATDPSQVGVIQFKPSIYISNTVYADTRSDNGAACARAPSNIIRVSASVGAPVPAPNEPQELVKVLFGLPVTYCFIVTNTGDTHLNSVVVRDELLGITRVVPGILAPGANFSFFFPSTATSELINVAEATGNPVFSDGRTIPGLEPVQSVDPSAVGIAETNANIKVENKVYLGFNKGASCATTTAVEVRVHHAK